MAKDVRVKVTSDTSAAQNGIASFIANARGGFAGLASSARSAAGDLNAISKQIAKTLEPIDRLGRSWFNVKQALDPVLVTMGAVTRALTAASEAAAEGERIERRAVTAFSLRGDAISQTLDQLKAFNAQQQRSLGIAADDLLSIQSQLSLLGVRNDELEAATKLTIGLAHVTGDLDGAVLKVTKLLEGNEEALSKTGIEVKTLGEGVERLATFFGTAGEQSDTFAKKQKTLAATLGDTWQKVGTGLNTLLKPAFDGGASAIGGLNDALDRLSKKVADWRAGTQDFGGAISVEPLQEQISTEELASRRENERMDEEIAKTIDRLRKAQRQSDQEEKKNAERKAESDRKANERMRENAEKTRIAAGLALEEQADFVADLEAEQERRRNDAENARAEARLKIQQQNADRELEAAEERRNALADMQIQEEAFWSNGLDNIAQIGAQGIGNLIGGIVTSLASGETDVLSAAGRLLGGLMMQMGQAAIGMGTTALLASLIPAPWLWGVTGGPGAVGPALALIAGGAALTALGAGLGAASTPSQKTPSTGSRGGQPTRPRSGMRDLEQAPSMERAGNVANTFVINFDRGVIAASPRRFARELKEFLEGSDLSVGAPGRLGPAR